MVSISSHRAPRKRFQSHFQHPIVTLSSPSLAIAYKHINLPSSISPSSACSMTTMLLFKFPHSLLSFPACHWFYFMPSHHIISTLLYSFFYIPLCRLTVWPEVPRPRVHHSVEPREEEIKTISLSFFTINDLYFHRLKTSFSYLHSRNGKKEWFNMFLEIS